jgi:hypothetical protein
MYRSKRTIGIDFDPIGKCRVNNSSIEADKKMSVNSCVHRSDVRPQPRSSSSVLFRSGDKRASPSERKQMSNFAITSTRTNADRNATSTLDSDEDGMNRRAIRHHHGDAFTTFGLSGKDR